MKRDASGRPVADTEEDKQKQGGAQENPSDGSQTKQYPQQAPQEADRGQKGSNPQKEGETNQGTGNK